MAYTFYQKKDRILLFPVRFKEEIMKVFGIILIFLVILAVTMLAQPLAVA